MKIILILLLSVVFLTNQSHDEKVFLINSAKSTNQSIVIHINGEKIILTDVVIRKDRSTVKGHQVDFKDGNFIKSHGKTTFEIERISKVEIIDIIIIN